MSKSISIKNDLHIIDIRDGKALMATKLMSMAELIAMNKMSNIETVFSDNPPNNVRKWLKAGYVVFMLTDDSPYCTVFTLNKIV